MEMQKKRGGKRRERIVVKKYGKKLDNLDLGIWEIFILILQLGGGHQIISTLKVKMVKEGGGGYMTSVILV